MATKKAIIFYRSGWPEAFIHYNSHDSWEMKPLHRNLNHFGWFTVEIPVPSSGRVFVMTN
jgi:hypothetical protein